MLDIELQKRILETARAKYPRAIDNPVETFANVPEEKLWENIEYLVQKGLVEGKDASAAESPIYYLDLKITAVGIDSMG